MKRRNLVNAARKRLHYGVLLGDLQCQMSAVSSRGVDQEAAACVTMQEQTVGDVAQMLVKLRAWATQEQQDMRKRPERGGALPHVVLGAVELAHGDLLGLRQIEKGISAQGKIASAKAAEQRRLDDLVVAMEDASTKLACDRAELLTTRNELVTKLGARYPDYAWSSLFARNNERANLSNTR